MFQLRRNKSERTPIYNFLKQLETKFLKIEIPIYLLSGISEPLKPSCFYNNCSIHINTMKNEKKTKKSQFIFMTICGEEYQKHTL